MNYEKEIKGLKAGYEQLAASIMSTGEQSPEKDPVKLEWAKQEGYQPQYDPNAGAVIWSQKPKPAYQQNHLMNLEGSMSPERLAEAFPAFGWKQKHADGVLQEIIQKALDGGITTQRAKELVYQLALNAEKEAWGEGKPKGAGKSAANFDQTMSKASKNNKVAG